MSIFKALICINRFKCDDAPFNGREISIAEYYRVKYDIVLRYTNWPLVQKGRQGQKMTFYPLEVCNMADRTRVPNKLIKPADQSNIIKLTAIEPWKRLDMIKQKAAVVSVHCSHA